jgi:D-glycero-beta-D-manno-heptose 1-phosphate adenylyltransferase
MGRMVDDAGLRAALHEARAAGRRVVLTNGCFDLLHLGHVRYLRAARELGDVLVVGVNSDDSVRRLKGANRPLVPAADRAEVLAALEPVDLTVVFDETTAERLAAEVKPDVYVKGADYGAGSHAEIDHARLPEARVVTEHGGRVVLIPVTPDRSTTAMVERIRAGVTPA